MGLRAPSEWETRSSSTQTQDNSGKGLSPGQEKMDKATSPAAGQAQNQVTKPGEVTAEAYGAQQAQQKQAKEQAKEKQGFNPIEQQLQQAETRLTSFGTTLRGYVNQFMNVPTATGTTTGAVTPQGTFGVTDTSGAAVSQTETEKLAQQKTMQDYLKSSGFARDIAGRLVGKGFTESMAEATEGFNPEVRSTIDTMLSMSQRLDELKKRGLASSTEARSLQEQLDAMDSHGMVSGLQRARDDYESLMGQSSTKKEGWYKSGADAGFSALDLASMDVKKVSEEIQKAITAKSGIFGGDYHSEMRSTLNSMDGDAAAERQKEYAANQELQRAYSAWAEYKGKDLTQLNKDFNDTFDSVGKQLLAEAQSSGNTKEAQFYMEALSASGGFAKYIKDAVSDPNSGLSTTQRNQLAGVISQMQGGMGDKDSIIHNLATTGTFQIQTTGADGRVSTNTITPSNSEKMALMHIIDDPSLNEAQKDQKLAEFMDNLKVGQGTVNSAMAASLDQIKKTGLQGAGIATFKTAIMNSLKSFAGSKTENAFRTTLGIKDEDWKKMSQDEKNAALKTAWEKLPPEQKKGFYDTMVAQSKAADAQVKASAEGAMDTITKSTAQYNGEIAEWEGTPEKPGKITELKNTLAGLGEQVWQQLSGTLGNPNYYSADGVIARASKDKLLNDRLKQFSQSLGLGGAQPEVANQYGALIAGIYQMYSDNLGSNGSAARIPEGLKNLYNELELKMPKFMSQARAQRSGAYPYFDSQIKPILDAYLKNMPSWVSTFRDDVVKNPQKYNPSAQTAVDNIKKGEEYVAGLKKKITDSKADYTSAQELLKTLDDPMFNPEAIVKGALGNATGTGQFANFEGREGQQFGPMKTEDSATKYGQATDPMLQDVAFKLNETRKIAPPDVKPMLDKITQAASMPPDWGRGNAERANTRVQMVHEYLEDLNPDVSGPARKVAQTAVSELAEQIRVKGMDRQGNHAAVIKQWLNSPSMLKIIASVNPSLIQSFANMINLSGVDVRNISERLSLPEMRAQAGERTKDSSGGEYWAGLGRTAMDAIQRAFGKDATDIGLGHLKETTDTIKANAKAREERTSGYDTPGSGEAYYGQRAEAAEKAEKASRDVREAARAERDSGNG